MEIFADEQKRRKIMKNISKENLKKRLQFFQPLFVVLMVIALFTKFYLSHSLME